LALTAALPSQAESLPVLPISDGSLWQTLILSELEIPFIILPQRGTVSATALDLAFILTEGEILIAGMDLANADIRSHARPYSLDRIIDEKAGRFSPAYSRTYIRSSLIKAGGSYGVYASWFEKQLALYPKRLRSLGENNPVFGSIKETKPRSFTEENRKKIYHGSMLSYGQLRRYREEDVRSRPGKALAILGNALKNHAAAAKLKEELTALLFKACETVSQQELIDAIYSLAGLRE